MSVFGGVNHTGQPTNDLYEYSLGSNFLMNWSNGNLKGQAIGNKFKSAKKSPVFL